MEKIRGSSAKLTNDTPAERPDLLLRAVALRGERDGWPSDTEGTIVEAFADGAIVEIADKDGCTLAMLPLPYSAVALKD